MKKYLFIITTLLSSLTFNSVYAVKASDVLSDTQNYKVFKGVKVRKATVAATIENTKQLDILFLNKGDHSKIEELIKDQRPLSKALWAIDLIKIQPINLWINDTQRPGRTLVATMILQACPQLITNGIKDTLKTYLPFGFTELNGEIKKVLAIKITE